MDGPANRPVRYADLRLLRTDEGGGRRTPLLSGYGWVAPGGAARVRVTPFSPDFWTRLRPGDVLTLCEGWRVIGVATVVPSAAQGAVG